MVVVWLLLHNGVGIIMCMSSQNSEDCGASKTSTNQSLHYQRTNYELDNGSGVATVAQWGRNYYENEFPE